MENILADHPSEDISNFDSAFKAYGEKDAAGKALRKDGFRSADTNGNGIASLAELELFIKVALDKKCGREKGALLFHKYRPSYLYAYNNAKSLHSGSTEVLAGAKSATEDDYVSFSEFRVFTLYLRIYATMFDTFADIDGETEGRTEEDDSRVDKDEFMKWFHSSDGGPKFKAFEDVNSDEDAEELFSYLDTDNSGLIIFSEWSDSIKQVEIEEGTELGVLLKGDLVPTPGSKPLEKTRSLGRTRSKEKAKPKKKNNLTPAKKKPAKRSFVLPPKVAGAFVPAKKSSADLKDFILAFQPFAERSIIFGKLRKQAFKSIDSNGNGKCSLAEISQHVRTALKKEHDEVRGEELFDLFRPTYIRAFSASKAIAKTDDPEDDNYINFSEFRVLNAYLCVYAGMGEEFFKIDGGGDGVTEDDDRRVEMTEWIKTYSKFSSSAFTGLRGIKTDEDASTIFKEMDADGKGMVLFSEFCEYIRTKEMENKTPLGKLLYGTALKSKAVGQ